jgi:hypothetical protein
MRGAAGLAAGDVGAAQESRFAPASPRSRATRDQVWAEHRGAARRSSARWRTHAAGGVHPCRVAGVNWRRPGAPWRGEAQRGAARNGRSSPAIHPGPGASSDDGMDAGAWRRRGSVLARFGAAADGCVDDASRDAPSERWPSGAGGPAEGWLRGLGEAVTAVCTGMVRAVADPWAALSPDAVMTSRRCTFGAAWSTRWRVVSGGSCGGREPP